MFAIFVAPYVDSIFLLPSLNGDVRVAKGHKLVLLYEDRLHGTNDGPIRH